MKNITKIFFVFLLINTLISCASDDRQDPSAHFSAVLNGSSQVPATTSTASGTATASYNPSTNKFTVSVPYSGMTPTVAFIRTGAAGTTGPAVLSFPVLESPLLLIDATLTENQEDDLMSNLFYIDLHSDAYPDGEIRGQLIMD